MASYVSKPLYGCLTKNHLVCGLQFLQWGQGKWDGQAGYARPPSRSAVGSEELWEALDRGVYVEVIAWQALAECIDGLRALQVGNNLDHALAMPEHEVELLQRTWDVLSTSAPTSDASKHDVAAKQLSKLSAGTCSDDDIVACISLAKAIGQIHVRAISAFHFQFVNATLLRVSLDFFIVVSKSVPLEAPWVVVVVLCAQYVSTDVVATG